jgi:hypothetical protein
VGRSARVITFMVLALGGCGRGCGCVEGQTTYESLDGKVKVELVRSVRWGTGHLPGTITSFSVRVHAEEVFDEPVACDHVDLAEDDAGKLVAFRCKGDDQPWTVLRLHGGQRRLRECNAPVGRGAVPAWSGLRPVSASVDRILGCMGNETGRLHAELMRTGRCGVVRGAPRRPEQRRPVPARGPALPPR